MPVDDMAPVREDGAICSNIEDFQGCNEPVFGLNLATQFKFCIPNDFTGYVRFTIDDTYVAQDTPITPKQTFDELFGKKNLLNH